MRNLTKIFANTVFILVILLFSASSCDRDQEYYNVERVIYDADSKEPLVCFLLDRTDRVNRQYNNHIRKTINYTKIPYKQLEINSFNRKGIIPKSTKVLIIQNTKSLSKKAMNSIIEYVANGHTVYLPNVTENKQFGFLAGVKPNVVFTTNAAAQGFHFKKAIIPDFENRAYKNNNIHYGFDRDNYKKDIEIWATAANDRNYPTILRHQIGNGQVITINSTQEADKQDRGLLFGALLSGLEQVPYPIVSVSAMFLDDFPAPLYKANKEPVTSELKMNQADFYEKQWWPDMLKLAKKYNMKYTTVACFDYRGNTEPPFLYNEWESSKSNAPTTDEIIPDRLMKEVIKNGHESGLHGYNHQSLVKSDWPNPDFMETSLTSAYKRWKSLNYGNLPVSYVPPSNHIDSLGIDALEKGAPTIKIMASIYLGHFNDGGNREYDDEPYSYYLFDFPRITSGYVLNEELQFNQQSIYLYTGIWSHFIHPDDVYQIPNKSNEKSKGAFKYRNSENYGWITSPDGSPGMLPRFDAYLKKTQNLFPMMRFLTTEDATSMTKSWRHSFYNYEFNNNELTVSSTDTNEASYWFMYVSLKNEKEVESHLTNKNIKFTKTPLLNGHLYNMNTKTAKLSSKITNHFTPIHAANLRSIKENYIDYLSGNHFFDNIDDEIAHLVSLGVLDKAISLLKHKIETSITFIEKDFIDLQKYYEWNNQESTIWSLLESQYLKSDTNNSNDYVIFSKRFAKTNGYPSLKVRKKWMQRQLQLYPKDAALKSEYNTFFILKDDVDLSTKYIISFLNTSHNTEENTKFFLLLLARDQEKAKQFLNTKTPCKDEFLVTIADQIAWLYADQKEYKAAVAWSKCTTKLDAESVAYWRTSLGEFEFLKNENFPEYIAYLLEHNPPRALQELINKTPCNTYELSALSESIAYAFGNIGAYRKALNWSKCAVNFPIGDQLQWYLELKDYTIVTETYTRYKKEHPEDIAVDFIMVEAYIEMQDYRKAFALYEKLKPGEEKDKLRKRLNENILYRPRVEQRYLLNHHPTVFYEEVKEKLSKQLRLNHGNTLEVNSNVLADQLDPTFLSSNLIYSFYSKKDHLYRFGLTQSRAYPINVNFTDPSNINHELLGIAYGFRSRERPEKITYKLGGEFNYENNGNVFYFFNSGISLAKENSFTAVDLLHTPVDTGPGYSLSIYRTQLSVFQEFTFKKRHQTTFSFEGNHYNDDNVLDGLLLFKQALLFKLGRFSQLAPYVETAGMLGTTDLSSGFPYWTIDERLYGGLGIGYLYEDPTNKITISLNAAAFKDTFSDQFLRYGGQISYPIFKYFYLNASAEFFTLDNFYSNNISGGLKYYFIEYFQLILF